MSQGCLPNCIFLLHIMLSRVPLHIVTESKDQTFRWWGLCVNPE